MCAKWKYVQWRWYWSKTDVRLGYNSSTNHTLFFLQPMVLLSLFNLFLAKFYGLNWGKQCELWEEEGNGIRATDDVHILSNSYGCNVFVLVLAAVTFSICLGNKKRIFSNPQFHLKLKMLAISQRFMCAKDKMNGIFDVTLQTSNVKQSSSNLEHACKYWIWGFWICINDRPN